MRKCFAAAILGLMVASTIAAAQDDQSASKNEVAVTVAHIFVSDQGVPSTGDTIHFGKGFSFEGDYARRLHDFRWSAVFVEVPVVFNPDEDLNYATDQIPLQYSAIYVTPALRFNLLQNLPFSPWFSFGGGVAHYVASKNLVFYGTNPGPRVDNNGTIEGGFGVDVRIPKFNQFRFRGELRDFWSGEPPLNVNTGKTRQHNYYMGGGVIFNF